MKPLILIDCHEGVHELLQLQHAVAATNAAYLIILPYAIRLNARIIDDERYRLLDVGTDFYRCGLVEDAHFGAEDFMPVFDFNTPQTVFVRLPWERKRIVPHG